MIILHLFHLLLLILEPGDLEAGVLVLVVNGGIRLAKVLGGFAALHQRHHRADRDEHDENRSQRGA